MHKKFVLLLMMSALWGLLAAQPSPAGEILKSVRQKGVLRCGINNQVAGFARQDAAGRWQGFEVDFCRAVAAAVLGDPGKASFTPMSAPTRFPVLLSGTIDLLAHTATWTMGREAGVGIVFPAIYFYDGQTFAVRDDKKPRRFEDLAGMSICVVKQTTHVANMANFFGARGIAYTPVIVDSTGEGVQAVLEGRCQACTSERSILAALQEDGKQKLVILPGQISKEPLAPAIRPGDEQWASVIRWVLFALIEAEERGITRENVRSLQKESADPDLRWFLNSCGERAKDLGLNPDWAADVIAAVGNYGEIYDRNLGSGSPLKLDRGLNRLWKDGGLFYAPLFQ